MGSQDKFEVLIKTTDLYSQAFIERFGMTNPHWETENWSRRERSLCHDMVCVLLANSEPNANLEEMVMKSLNP